MKPRRLKGMHDITTAPHKPATQVELDAPELNHVGSADGFRRKMAVTSPRTWVFTTKPRFIRHPKPTEKSLLVEKVEEPIVNIFQETEEVVVLAQMPDADEQSINCQIKDDILLVCAEAKDTWGTKRYEKEILLPFVVCSSSLKTSYKDQILEIKLTRNQKEKSKIAKGKKELT